MVTALTNSSLLCLRMLLWQNWNQYFDFPTLNEYLLRKAFKNEGISLNTFS